MHGAGVEIIEQHKIGAPAGRDKPAVAQAKGARGGNAGGAVGGERRRAKFYRRADHEIEMAFLKNIEGVAVIGAEGDEGRIALGDDRGERMQVFRHRPLPDQRMHALRQFLQRLFGARRLMVGADAGGKIAVEVKPAQQRRVSVYVAALEQREFCQHIGRARQHAGKIHEFGEADDPLVLHQRREVGRLQPRAAGFKMRRRHAARQVDAQVHDGLAGAGQKILYAGKSKHIGDFMRIANRRGDAIGQHQPVKLMRRHQRGFDMQMRVDETRRNDFAVRINFTKAGIVAMRADNAVAANGDIGLRQRAGHKIEQPPAFQHQIRRRRAAPLRDGAGEKGGVMRVVGFNHSPSLCIPCLLRKPNAYSRQDQRPASPKDNHGPAF